MTEQAIDTLSPIHFAELTDAARVNPILAAAFLREQSAPEVRRTHLFDGRFENTYIPRGRLPEFRPVANLALRVARRILRRRDLRYGFWFNEMPPGRRTTLHDHSEGDELLSAVYYIHCPTDSGRLILHDDQAQILVTPRAGLLVLFPPDLPHEVEVNASQATRLSVAFNFGPQRPAA